MTKMLGGIDLDSLNYEDIIGVIVWHPRYGILRDLQVCDECEGYVGEWSSLYGVIHLYKNIVQLNVMRPRHDSIFSEEFLTRFHRDVESHLPEEQKNRTLFFLHMKSLGGDKDSLVTPAAFDSQFTPKLPEQIIGAYEMADMCGYSDYRKAIDKESQQDTQLSFDLADLQPANNRKH